VTKFIIWLYRKIFARTFFTKINKALFHLSLRGLGIKNHENYKVSGEIYFIKHILSKVIKTDLPLFFDVGANIGCYSDMLLDSFANASIHAFEPHPQNYSSLKKRLPSNRIKAHNIALGNIRGQMILYDIIDYDGSAYASLHKDVITEINRKDFVSLEVEVDTLDNFAEKEGISYIDFLKIDTEGHELAVLQGALNLLDRKSIGCIHFEFNEMNVISRTFFRDIRKVLHDYNFYRLLPRGLLPLDDDILTTEIFAYQNIIALPKFTNPLIKELM
jgi:FkbM family methyltransferase